MNDRDFIISGFDHDAVQDARNQGAYISLDFAKAKKLSRTGSTCDAYVGTIQRRRVFIKRLKAEYRNNPLYRAAFDKEYELGISLSHPSLARYVGFGYDYIVMDFIEGDTLADLIRRDDQRLKNRKFVKRKLCELIDVIEYLHCRNIIHCDIKADNILISPYDNRPISLIDFDKAYTPWLDSTHGNIKKFGCESCSDGTIDFRGFGKIASSVGLKRVATVCKKDNVSVKILKRKLKNDGLHSQLLLAICVPIIIITGISGVFILNKKEENTTPTHTSLSTEYKEEIDTAGRQNMNPNSSEDKNDIAKGDNNTLTEGTKETSSLSRKTEHVKHDETTGNDQKNSYTNQVVDDIVKKYYGPLYPRIEYLQTLVDVPGASSKQLSMVIKTYAKDQLTAQGEIFKAIYTRYGLTEPFDILPMLGTSIEWVRFMTLDSKINALYSREIERRSKKNMEVIN